ncbi:MAG: DUF779 domain-containing protein [Bdellovibrionaceae bacterium]|nr:DUF779 domain-containing protein [Pseudobdellovibrionaceae bacterium]
MATPATLELIEFLKSKHGPLIFHQSGGCCDGSSTNCLLPGELSVGEGDILLGEMGDVRFTCRSLSMNTGNLLS